MKFTLKIIIFTLLVNNNIYAQIDSTQILLDSSNNEIIVNSLQFSNSNPASAGILNTIRIEANHQIELKTNKPYSNFGVDAIINNKEHFKLGLGMFSKHFNYNNFFIRDFLGLSFSGKLIYGHHQTSVGLSGALFTNSFNWNKATFGDMIDPRLGFIYNSTDMPRSGTASNVSYNFGAIHQWKQLKIGLSVQNFTQANNSILAGFSFSPMVYNANISYSFHLNKFTLTPMLNLTNNGFNSFENYSIIGQYKNKYFILANVKTFEWSSAQSYSFESGAIFYNSLYVSLGYTITPRLLDYAQQFNFQLSYIIPTKK